MSADKTEQDIIDQREKDWELVISGMERALQWVKDNRQYLCSFHINLHPNRKRGVHVCLGFSDIDSERTQILKTLFAGKTVQKKHKPGDTRIYYQLDDDELNLRFTWDIWDFSRATAEQEVVTEVFTI